MSTYRRVAHGRQERPYQDEVEDCFTVYRAGRRAQTILDTGSHPESGGVAVFAGALRVEKSGAAVTWWPIKDLTHEPGDVFPPGVTAVEGWAKPYGTKVRVRFHVIVGEIDLSEVPPPSFEFVDGAKGKVNWAAALQPNIRVQELGKFGIRRALRRQAGQVEPVRNRIIEISRPYAEMMVDKKGGIKNADRPDMLQELLLSIAKKADKFAGPGRPDSSWHKALENDLRRDADRMVWDLRGESESIGRIRRWLSKNPHVKDATEAQALMSREKLVARLVTQGMSKDEAEEVATPDMVARNPVASLAQFRRAITPPVRVLSIDASYGDSDSGSTFGDTIGLDEDGYVKAEEAGVDLVAEALASVSGIPVDDIRRMFAEAWSDGEGKATKLTASDRAKLARMEQEFFSPFVLVGESWKEPDDREAIKHRCMTAISTDLGFVLPEEIARQWDSAAADVARHNGRALLWGMAG